jgi:hypothetical protein
VYPILDRGGTRIKLLDACAMGKVVMSTSNGREGIAITHEGNFLVDDGLQGLVWEVARTFRSDALHDRLLPFARVIVRQRCGWTGICRDLEAAYRCTVLRRCARALKIA